MARKLVTKRVIKRHSLNTQVGLLYLHIFFHLCYSLETSLPPVISKDTKFSSGLQERLNTQIEAEIAEYLQRYYAELDLKTKLDSLDDICKEAKKTSEGKENSGVDSGKKKAW